MSKYNIFSISHTPSHVNHESYETTNAKKLQRLSFLQQLMKLFNSCCFISHTLPSINTHRCASEGNDSRLLLGWWWITVSVLFSGFCCHGYIRSNPHRERVQKTTTKPWGIVKFLVSLNISLSWVVNVCSPHKAHNDSAVKTDDLTARL